MWNTQRAKVLVVIGVAGLGTRPALAQWYWPPTGGMQVSPACIDAHTAMQVTMSGQWPNTCIPNENTLSVSGTDIDFHAIRNPPPLVCGQVVLPWSQQGSIGPLPAGTYSVYATYYAGTEPMSQRVLMGTIDVVGACPGSCYPNCDGSTTAPILNVLDFTCFLNHFAAGDSYANCDGSTTPPVLNILDFTCFLNAFATGCS